MSSRPNDKPNCGYPSANEAEMSSFSKEQMDQLLKLLKSNSSFDIPSVSLAQTGSDPHALSCCSNSAPWIIDSGASDPRNKISFCFHRNSRNVFVS